MITTMSFTVVLLEYGLDPVAAVGLSLGVLTGALRVTRADLASRPSTEVAPAVRS
ncbi:hypothetical protein [Amycolatopsis sp. NPDC049868]|uniref:hypothetical protein n=1 Tax=Amycolatopsis sp. NPDC049868 TaxID=3363934 RepID=UPI0037A9E323